MLFAIIPFTFSISEIYDIDDMHNSVGSEADCVEVVVFVREGSTCDIGLRFLGLVFHHKKRLYRFFVSRPRYEAIIICVWLVHLKDATEFLLS